MSQDPILQRRQLGPYTIVKKIGEGGMGAVYLANHRVLQVEHALKVLHPRMTGDSQLVQRYFREAKNSAKLVHPNIVQVVGADVVDGIYYLAMQYIDGVTLAGAARKGGLTVHQSVRYVHMVARALQYAHSKNIIHRDVKPGNVMIDRDDIAKLMDFGLVREVEGKVKDPDEMDQPLTTAGLMLGTPQYMPPEQWGGEEIDHRADLYALGVTLYYLLTGDYPFAGRTMAEMFKNVLQGKGTSVIQRRPKLDRDLAAIVERATRGEPAERFQSGADFAKGLEEWFGSHPPPPEEEGLAITSAGSDTMSAPLGVPSKAFKSTTKVNAVTRRRSSPPSTTGEDAILPTAAREAPTIPAGSVSQAEAPPPRKGPLVGVIAGFLIAAAGVAGYFLTKGPDESAVRVELPAGEGNEASPLRTAKSAFSIPGDAAGATVTLNGKPYAFGSSISLAKGLNKLELALGTGSSARPLRTFFVVHDPDPPVLVVPALAAAMKGEVLAPDRTFTLAGSVTDDDREAVVELTVGDKAARALPIVNGQFTDLLELGDDPVRVELRARDRAGNQAAPLVALLVPDRGAPVLTWGDGASWFGTRQVALAGICSRIGGVTITCDGRQVPLTADGKFTLALEREAGRHTVTVEAKDGRGRAATLVREVTVDLEAPRFLELTPASGGSLALESLPGTVVIAGKLDGSDVQLSVGGAETPVGQDGVFRQAVTVSAYGELKVDLSARDPAGRSTPSAVTLRVRPLLYKPAGKNAQGQSEYVRQSDGMTVVAVPGGEFTQGVADGPGDAPPRPTRLAPFLIDKYEVSIEQFARWLNAQRASPEDAVTRGWLVPDAPGKFANLEHAGGRWRAVAGAERLPATGVTWAGARAYARWADPEGGDLPSEAQWEFAARGTEGRAFPWGNDPPNPGRCNFKNAGFDEPQPVEVCPDGASPFGLLNLSGNVEEWCLDWYDVSGYGRLPVDDPILDQKPPGGDRRAVRGGSYLSPFTRKNEITKPDAPCDLCAYGRGRRAPATGAGDRGFRCVSRERLE